MNRTIKEYNLHEYNYRNSPKDKNNFSQIINHKHFDIG